MSQVEENRENNKSGSRSTVVASLAALGSVIAASSCCLPLLPFLFAAGAAGTPAVFFPFRAYLLFFFVVFLSFCFFTTLRGPPRDLVTRLIRHLFFLVSPVR